MILKDAKEKMIRKTLKVTSAPPAWIKVMLLGINFGALNQLKQFIPKINRQMLANRLIIGHDFSYFRGYFRMINHPPHLRPTSLIKSA